MNIGVFGGTFNPIHAGHVRLAYSYEEAFGLDRMLVIPSAAPPHKRARGLVAGAHRMAMCKLAFCDDQRFEVSGLELERGGMSYTIDTLHTLQARYPRDALHLLMGSDMFLSFKLWRRWQEICELAQLCVGCRELGLREQVDWQRASLEAAGARCAVVELEPLVVSSTEMRALLRAGTDCTGLIPDKVYAYIRQHGLYGS